ncbi:CBS domain-containing protein [Actinophytocola sp.]|uniref:CBS domain-containing protein n=1 Tax=Actinophytocola sp. TaxID=1872138 RepID=UPI002D3CCBE3|nr:CBS domain-containing protein [Actinophytocola sp.]HYQ63967.1 CBS domain-containing protein [Actinophytocola sp.]
MNAVTTGIPAMTVGTVMTRCPVSVRAGAPFATVAALLSRDAIGAVPVVDRDGRLVGAVSEGDLIGGREGAGVTARDVMDRRPHTVAEDTPLPAAARLLTEPGVRRLYVTEHGRLVGVVSRRDLLTTYLRDDDAIREDVELALADQPPLSVSVRAGVVLLLGRVEWRSGRAALDERVRTVPGVVEVRNRLGYVFDDGTRPPAGGTTR